MPLAEQPKRVVISVNPTAGRGRGAELSVDLRALLREAGYHAEIVPNLGQACRRAIDLDENRDLRALVGVGGDGTLAALLNSTPPGLPLAIFPQGTENLLGKYLGIGRASAEQMASVICHGHQIRIDAAQITAQVPSAGCGFGRPTITSTERVSRLFFLMAGFGFDGEVIRTLQTARRGNISHLSYLKPIAGTLRRYSYPEMHVTAEAADGTHNSFVCRWLFAFNCPKYAGGLPIAPAADCADGLLDYCAFQRGSAATTLKYLTMVLLGRQGRSQESLVGRAAKLRVQTTQQVPIQIDGDFLGYTLAELTCCPGRLTLLAPREFRPGDCREDWNSPPQ